MSTFVCFDGKNYKLPDALILGRGAPFDIVDRTLARAHARLVYKKGIWKIKDLSSDCGIFINGNKIRPSKFHAIVPGDKILLGNVPLELHESFAEGTYVEVKNFTAHDINDYAPLIYSVLFILGGLIAWSESSGDSKQDMIFLGCVALFLKFASVVTRALRTVYFPVQVVTETNLTEGAATFHITGDKNFSLKYENIENWYIVGKCFFIKIYKKDMIFLLNEGQDELAALLKQHCLKKRATAEPVLEKLALLPLLFILICWTCLYFADTRFFHFMGHGFGMIGLAGLMAFFFSEHLRELLPIPTGTSPGKVAMGLASIVAFGLVIQFSQFQNHYNVTKQRKELSACFTNNRCGKVNFTHLTQKKLPEEEARLLAKICAEGNQTACLINQRKPASK
ncbi:MAG: FHA domain-containing protein [Bacteriovoracaceae bacterium]